MYLIEETSSNLILCKMRAQMCVVLTLWCNLSTLATIVYIHVVTLSLCLGMGTGQAGDGECLITHSPIPDGDSVPVPVGESERWKSPLLGPCGSLLRPPNTIFFFKSNNLILQFMNLDTN